VAFGGNPIICDNLPYVKAKPCSSSTLLYIYIYIYRYRYTRFLKLQQTFDHLGAIGSKLLIGLLHPRVAQEHGFRGFVFVILWWCYVVWLRVWAMELIIVFEATLSVEHVDIYSCRQKWDRIFVLQPNIIESWKAVSTFQCKVGISYTYYY
jgi:hypothetical protein